MYHLAALEHFCVEVLKDFINNTEMLILNGNKAREKIEEALTHECKDVAVCRYHLSNIIHVSNPYHT